MISSAEIVVDGPDATRKRLRGMLAQASAEKKHLEDECQLLTELLLLKQYKNLTDNRLNMSNARRRSIPQKKIIKKNDPVSTDDQKLHGEEDSDMRQESHELDHTIHLPGENESENKNSFLDPL